VPRVIRPRLRVLAVLVSLAFVGACGGSSGGASNGIEKLSAKDALAKAQAAVSAVSSMHAAGTISQGGKTLTLDVTAGKDQGQGTVDVGGGQLELRFVDGTAYMRGEASALTAMGAPAAAATLAAGKWLKSSATNGDFAGFVSLLDIKQFTDQLLTPKGTPTAGKLTEINGAKAYTLIDPEGNGTLYIAATGQPFPLRVEKTGTDGGKVDFSDFGADLNVAAPDGAIDIAQLSGAG
jgi:hypothetical protein